MREVFASYSRQDDHAVKELVGDIESLGFRVWLDQRIAGGEQWWREILAQIRSCDVFLFVISEGSLRSKACRLEYEYAIALGKPVVPVVVDTNLSPSVLPSHFAKTQILEFKGRSHAWALQFARALGSVPVAPSLPSPPPAEPGAPISYLVDLRDRIDSAEELDFDRQSALLLRIKGALRDPETSMDSRVLLERFRARRDLLAEIAKETDETLLSWSAHGHSAPPPANKLGIRIALGLGAITALALTLLLFTRTDQAPRSRSLSPPTATMGTLVPVPDRSPPPLPVVAPALRPALDAGIQQLNSTPVDPPKSPSAAKDERRPALSSVSAPNVVSGSSSKPAKPGRRPSSPESNTPAPRPVSPRVMAFSGTWMVRWTDPSGSYEGLLRTNGASGTLRLSHTRRTGEQLYVVETVSVEEKDGDLVIQGRDVRALGNGDITGYAPDHGHIAFVEGKDRAAAAFCAPPHTCFPGSAVRGN